jgi:hypothetical protein
MSYKWQQPARTGAENQAKARSVVTGREIIQSEMAVFLLSNFTGRGTKWDINQTA